MVSLHDKTGALKMHDKTPVRKGVNMQDMKMHYLKLQDLKMTDQIACHENGPSFSRHAT